MKKLGKILVTGGAGLVGSEVVRQLLAKGYEVVVVDNFSTSSMNSFEQHNNLVVYPADIRDEAKLIRVFRLEKNISAVIHLAAIHFIPYCIEHPKETMDVNVVGTRNILRIMTQFGVNRILFASSAAVYAPKEGFHLETDEIAPIDIYGDSKYLAEQVIAQESRKNKFVAQKFCCIYQLLVPEENHFR